ncbi:MAG: hypothetical protein JO132_08585, partial [Streptosporangiaceae bacterium]|nr:hypothetical protein [Streptosporangiaceae bacterium]
MITGIADLADPLGLAADAPLLAAWLDWTRRASQGRLTPMSIPGHHARQDLVGAVVAGDVPLYGGLEAIKHADALRADAEARGRAVGRRLVQALRGRIHPRQPGALPGDRPAGPGGDHRPDAAQVA